MTDHTRTIRLATLSSDQAAEDLFARLEAATVLVTADPSGPAVQASLVLLMANLRRLPVRLLLDPDGGDARLPRSLVDAVTARVSEIDPNRPLSLRCPLGGSGIHLHLGTSADADVRAVPHGHGVRLRRRGLPFPSLGRASGLGAAETAAALTSEAFKAVVGVGPDRARSLDALDFCPVTLREPGPMSPLPELNGALVGAGAIGTAVAAILRDLNATGALTVVDPQAFEDPNVTTYTLGSTSDALRAVPKVLLVRDALPGVDVTALRGTAQDLVSGIDARQYAMPRTVFGAVDSVDARWEIAAIHAALTLDGATGGATGTMVGLSEASAEGPCLRCYYPALPDAVTSAEERVYVATGLPLERLAAGDALHPDDLEKLDPEARARLKPHIGKPICGLARALDLVGDESTYAPSAAFVAQQAAALVVGAYIRRQGHAGGPFLSVQYNGLIGPVDGMDEPRRAQDTCRCQLDRDLIAQVRQARKSHFA